LIIYGYILIIRPCLSTPKEISQGRVGGGVCVPGKCLPLRWLVTDRGYSHTNR